MSVCDTCVVPMQDYLGLNNKSRMNKPSTLGINWRWRVTKEQLNDDMKDEILTITKTFGRYNWS